MSGLITPIVLLCLHIDLEASPTDPNLLLPCSPSRAILSALFILVDALRVLGPPPSSSSSSFSSPTARLLESFGALVLDLPQWREEGGSMTIKGKLQACWDLGFLRLVVEAVRAGHAAEGAANKKGKGKGREDGEVERKWSVLLEDVAKLVSLVFSFCRAYLERRSCQSRAQSNDLVLYRYRFLQAQPSSSPTDLLSQFTPSTTSELLRTQTLLRPLLIHHLPLLAPTPPSTTSTSKPMSKSLSKGLDDNRQSLLLRLGHPPPPLPVGDSTRSSLELVAPSARFGLLPVAAVSGRSAGGVMI
jgi:hypothetical protein